MAKKKPSRSGGGKQRFASRGAARGHRSGGLEKSSSPRPAPPSGAITPNRSQGFGGGERPYDYAAYESEKATPEYMSRLFAAHSFIVSPDELRLFWKFYELLRLHNASLDLTRIMGIEATVLKHFIDSAIVLRWFEPAGPVLDIGSGPGFPGIPLAIMRPGTAFLLAESRGKRVGFLRDVIAALRLKNVEVYPKSVREDSPLGEDYGLPVGDVVTRALETMEPTLERVRPFIRPGRRVAFLKGPACDEEIAAAAAHFQGVYRIAGDNRYRLPGTDQGRRLVVFEKTAIGL